MSSSCPCWYQSLRMCWQGVDGLRTSAHPTSLCFYVGWAERSEAHQAPGATTNATINTCGLSVGSREELALGRKCLQQLALLRLDCPWLYRRRCFAARLLPPPSILFAPRSNPVFHRLVGQRPSVPRILEAAGNHLLERQFAENFLVARIVGLVVNQFDHSVFRCGHGALRRTGK